MPGWLINRWQVPGRENNTVNHKTKPRPGKRNTGPYNLHLPGFLIEEQIGLGDAIKHVTYRLGIKPCGGCEKRASRLNQWMQFSANS